MKHKPISLGFAAFAAMTLTVACNVDPNRVDQDVDNTILKKKCAAENALDVEKVNTSREKLLMLDEAQVRNVVVKKGMVEGTGEASVKDAALAEQLLAVETNCSDLTAKIADEEGFKITNIDTHKLVLEKDGEVLTIEAAGVDVLMSSISEEDGINQISVTTTDKTSGDIKDIVVNSSVADKADRQILTKAQYEFMMSSEAMTETQEKLKKAVTAQSVGNPIIDKDGNVKVTWSEIKNIAEGK